jgi:LL-diaminopimelate aminotransferase
MGDNSLFHEVEKKVNAFKVSHPKERVIYLGLGDFTLPLVPAVTEAMHRAVDEMGKKDTFRGYPPLEGYSFLREAIVKNDYLSRGVKLEPGEIFINDGAKGDTANIGDLLRWDNTIGATDIMCSLYVDSNVLWGRAGTNVDGSWSNVSYIPCTKNNEFIPEIPKQRVDILYLCNPNNPTGAAMTKQQLRQWVNYAIKNDTLIIFDASYEAYIQDPDIPHSIYEIRGARKVAIEIRSYSKTAGFSGVRCGYTVIPKDLTAALLDGTTRIPLRELWHRWLTIRQNGVSYITQRGAEAIYSDEGKAQTREIIDYYMGNAAYMLDSLRAMGHTVYGGHNAPYLWLKIPNGTTSWKYFEQLLYSTGIVSIPGIGFGNAGEGYIRIAAYADRDDCREAMRRMRGKGYGL